MWILISSRRYYLKIKNSYNQDDCRSFLLCVFIFMRGMISVYDYGCDRDHDRDRGGVHDYIQRVRPLSTL